jgi:hypothetical protein
VKVAVLRTIIKSTRNADPRIQSTVSVFPRLSSFQTSQLPTAHRSHTLSHDDDLTCSAEELLHAVVGEWDDPNLDRNAVGDLEEDSPYPEVRSAVANTDDPDMPCNTWRAWLIGFIFAIIISGLNQFFFFRYPSVIIGV